ncbi:MAG: RNA polymerase factor sigma-54 [Kiritimatiellae bacterium]|nr:RNA polymerase factor sigma-54 [Kiritimatiellia bacterium]
MSGFSGELRQTQAQKQILAPQMRQGLHLLSLSLPELRSELQKELERNPVIDEVEATLERDTVSQKEREAAEYLKTYDSDYPYDETMPDPSWSADADALERRQRFFDSRTSEETLEEHLKAQLEMSDISPADIPLAETLIGELDSSGYFTGSIPDIVMVSGEGEAKIREVLKSISALDPPGCGATTLEECLLAQMDKLDGSPYQQEVREMLERGHLKAIADGRTSEVAKDLGTDPERLPDVLAALRTLEPRPGRRYTRSGKSVTYINPEVHAVNSGGRWLARVDDRSLPEIRISPRYVKMLESPDSTPETKAYIREKIAAADAIREAVERRQETVASISQAIFDAQPGFFTDGFKGLKPMTMQEIADKVGVHHTTVSRTVRDKYASTPRGTVELRKFFTSGYTTEDGIAVTRDSVMEKIKSLVEAEDRSRPLSDERISALLKAEGCSVARRTVAKYRSALGIPGAQERTAASSAHSSRLD